MMIKKLSIALPILALLISTPFFLEDRYFNESEAEVWRSNIEISSVQTFKEFRNDLDRQRLDNLRDKLVIINNLLRETPNDSYLKMRREEIKREIQRLEERLR